MKKPGTGIKALAGVGTAGVVYFGSGAVAEATGIAPGWKRSAIGAVLTAVAAFGASTMKATKDLATSIGVGGGAAAIALLFEPQLKSFMAERAVAPAAPEYMAPVPPPPPPALPPPPPPPPRPPTTEELIFGTIGETIGMFGKIFGSSGGSGMTYDEPYGAGAAMGIYEATRN